MWMAWNEFVNRRMHANLKCLTSPVGFDACICLHHLRDSLEVECLSTAAKHHLSPAKIYTLRLKVSEQCFEVLLWVYIYMIPCSWKPYSSSCFPNIPIKAKWCYQEHFQGEGNDRVHGMKYVWKWMITIFVQICWPCHLGYYPQHSSISQSH